MSAQVVAVIFGYVALVLPVCRGLNNGLARTPPMGWMSGERYGCNIDCVNYPDDCISEQLVKTTADALVQNGFQAAGYKYLVLDDCWMARTRDGEGKLQPDPIRFPSGMSNLASYIHSKGLKLGLYIDIGNMTCGGFPGSQGHFEQDAWTLAEWTVDMVKVGAYGVKSTDVCDVAYPDIGRHLNATGRPILYLCEWPICTSNNRISMSTTYANVSRVCNQFRTFKDVEDSWLSLEDSIKYYSGVSDDLLNNSKPGSWNDPDQLVIGDYGLSHEQERTQMALWCVMAAPLFISADVRVMSSDSRSVLLNSMAISINQDRLGFMGRVAVKVDSIYVWKKPLSQPNSYALVLIYDNISGGAGRVSIKLSDIGLVGVAVYNLTDVFTGRSLGLYKPWYTLDCEVNPTGTLFLLAVPASTISSQQLL